MPMKHYASFSDWKKDQSKENQKLIKGVSKTINDVAPNLETVVKWGQGCWTEEKNHNSLFIVNQNIFSLVSILAPN